MSSINHDYISTQILTTTINIKPDKITGDINQLILHDMKQRYEGVCNKDGYIKKDSIQLVERSIGEIKTIDSKSFIVYNITYRADVLSPAKGIQLDIIVDSITKMGIVGYIQLSENDTIKESPFIVIAPKEFFTDEMFESVKVNGILKVEIEAFRVKYRASQIQLVVKPV
jgi:DNA-directed RNA polymerase subunit E'/Rpb7